MAPRVNGLASQSVERTPHPTPHTPHATPRRRTRGHEQRGVRLQCGDEVVHTPGVQRHVVVQQQNVLHTFGNCTDASALATSTGGSSMQGMEGGSSMRAWRAAAA
eukprot:364296-Chlamydomonas_euryale.AAC.2